MEKMERVVETYYRAFDGRKFINPDMCERYEYLTNKYMNEHRHRRIRDGEDIEQDFFFINNHEEAIEVSDYCVWLNGYRCNTNNGGKTFERGWVWVKYEYPDGMGPAPALQTIDDFILLQKEYVRDYTFALHAGEQLKNTVGPREDTHNNV